MPSQITSIKTASLCTHQPQREPTDSNLVTNISAINFYQIELPETKARGLKHYWDSRLVDSNSFSSIPNTQGGPKSKSGSSVNRNNQPLSDEFTDWLSVLLHSKQWPPSIVFVSEIHWHAHMSINRRSKVTRRDRPRLNGSTISIC